MTWVPEDPSTGSSEGLDGARATLLDDGLAAGLISDSLSWTITGMRTVWSGSGVKEWCAALDAHRARVTAFAEVAGTAAEAIAWYTEEFERIQRATLTQQWLLAEVADDRSKHDRRVAEFVGPVSADQQRIWAKQSAALDHEREVSLTLIARLAEERTTAENTFTGLMQAAIPATWGATRRLAADLGISDPSIMTPHHLAAAAAAGTLGLERLFERLMTLTPEQVAEYWAILPRSVIDALIAAHPDAIGNLGGAAYADRSLANVSRLDQLLTDAQTAYDQALEHAGDPLSQAVGALAQALDRLEAAKYLADNYANGKGLGNKPPQYLISLDTTVEGVPLAAISVGDLDTATDATFFVPGMGSSVNEAEDYLRGVIELRKAVKTSAAVLWLGYRSPDVTNVLSDDHARTGGAQLGAALGGYDAMRKAAGGGAKLNVIGHSYGTTTAAYALNRGDYDVDTFTMLGSAGIPPDIGVNDLNMPPKDVYATRANWDLVAGFGQHASDRFDPEAVDWGAHVFGADGTDTLEGVTEHNAVGSNESEDDHKYLGKDTECMANIFKILQGDGEHTTGGRRFLLLPNRPRVPSEW
ncbi:Alpha/beta hydrolase [Plantibacter flavus]|uniref:Alpha/beta hydrolase family protein n=1 Tax=Plantibacter flavus TaxID=150123 RepID=A0A3N2BZJ5_9MICO|nr:alpha/beta hydrolase [Plantibacter flavus]ROR80653.1 alpha/beta hydrolase family protein [Plantibacter flavus]SMG32501.1 Alpha/beta hydrolase [Plantibacter flavus]